jgi:hypothetical protein
MTTAIMTASGNLRSLLLVAVASCIPVSASQSDSLSRFDCCPQIRDSRAAALLCLRSAQTRCVSPVRLFSASELKGTVVTVQNETGLLGRGQNVFALNSQSKKQAISLTWRMWR